ncbi:MAG: DUF502 domain-containing protein [Planctomycetes bacterium]|nr:DUF502 domain-containing protein [Planctomycetota bacterium]
MRVGAREVGCDERDDGRDVGRDVGREARGTDRLVGREARELGRDARGVARLGAGRDARGACRVARGAERGAGRLGAGRETDGRELGRDVDRPRWASRGTLISRPSSANRKGRRVVMCSSWRGVRARVQQEGYRLNGAGSQAGGTVAGVFTYALANLCRRGGGRLSRARYMLIADTGHQRWAISCVSTMANQPSTPSPSRSSPFGPALRTFFRGLAAILPLALTGWLITWAVVGGETLLRKFIVLWLPEEQYWDGMGFVLAIALVFLFGLLMYSFIARRLYKAVTALLERIPIVKTIYGMFVDVARLVASGDEKPFRKVVLIKLPEGIEQIGFLTREAFDDHPDIGVGKVAVYLPMSYQLGGFTVIVAADSVREVSMSVEEALRFCVTAGVSRPEEV